MQLCIEKLLKFEICLKIRILLKYFKTIIKTIPKIFNEIYQSLYKLITVKVYCILNKVKDCDLRKIC